MGRPAPIAAAMVSSMVATSPAPASCAACSTALVRWRTLATAAGAAPDPAHVHVVWALLNHNDFVTLR